MEVFLTIVVLSFWFLFPIGMFLSVSHVDKNTDQIIRLDHLRHDSQPDQRDEVVHIPVRVERQPTYRPTTAHFRRWARH